MPEIFRIFYLTLSKQKKSKKKKKKKKVEVEVEVEIVRAYDFMGVNYSKMENGFAPQ